MMMIIILITIIIIVIIIIIITIIITHILQQMEVVEGHLSVRGTNDGFNDALPASMRRLSKRNADDPAR